MIRALLYFYLKIRFKKIVRTLVTDVYFMLLLCRFVFAGALHNCLKKAISVNNIFIIISCSWLEMSAFQINLKLLVSDSLF